MNNGPTAAVDLSFITDTHGPYPLPLTLGFSHIQPTHLLVLVDHVVGVLDPLC